VATLLTKVCSIRWIICKEIPQPAQNVLLFKELMRDKENIASNCHDIRPEFSMEWIFCPVESIGLDWVFEMDIRISSGLLDWTGYHLGFSLVQSIENSASDWREVGYLQQQHCTRD